MAPLPRAPNPSLAGLLPPPPSAFPLLTLLLLLPPPFLSLPLLFLIHLVPDLRSSADLLGLALRRSVFEEPPECRPNAAADEAEIAEDGWNWHLGQTWGLRFAINPISNTIDTMRIEDGIGTWVKHRGSNMENLALQNIQARVRMVLAFMLAFLMPWIHNKSGFYLILGSSNVDEGICGSLTKGRLFLSDLEGGQLPPKHSSNEVEVLAFQENFG